jgi:hypothetical protein
MNILKESQKYLDENNDIKVFDKKENSIEKKYISIENDNDNDNNNDNDNEYYFKNQDKLNKNKREINTMINNDIIIKRNKESLDIQNNLNKKNRTFNTDIINRNKNNKIPFYKIDITNSIKRKEHYNKKNKLKNRNYNYNSQSFTEGNISKNRFTELDEDIKIENKTLNQNIYHKNIMFNKDFNENSERNNYLSNTDSRVNRKNITNENFGKIKNKFDNDDNDIDNDDNNYDEDNYKINNNNTNSNNLNFNNTNNINLDENANLLKYSQTKSQLSEYVEDLDVIEYK